MKIIPPFIKDFLQETLNRLFIKKPKYFIYWQWISGLGSMVTGIPWALKSMGWDIPEPFNTLSNRVITFIGGAMFLMSQLTVSTPPVAQTSDGEAVKVTDPDKMPVTAKQEAKELKETTPPPPEVEVQKPESENKNQQL